MTQKRSRNSQSGFSLVELMVVIVIIGILAAMAAPVLSSYREDAKIAAAKSYGVQFLNTITAAAATSPGNVYPQVDTCDELAQVVNENGAYFSRDMSNSICPQGGDFVSECECIERTTGLKITYTCGLPPASCQDAQPQGALFENQVFFFPLLEVQTQLFLEVSTISGVGIRDTLPAEGEPF